MRWPAGRSGALLALRMGMPCRKRSGDLSSKERRGALKADHMFNPQVQLRPSVALQPPAGEIFAIISTSELRHLGSGQASSHTAKRRVHWLEET